MARSKSSRIYIKHRDGLCDFLWANMAKDGSIMLGFTEQGSEQTHAIFDKEPGELRAGDFIEAKPLPNPKITFHQSGYYKLTTNIGLREDTVDRCTIVGAPLKQITAPILLIEILIPNKLKLTEEKLTERDIILEAKEFPQKPWRCSIFAMQKEELFNIVESKIKFVSTSIIESTHALESEDLCLSFTLRVSNEDKSFPDKYYFFIPGEIKWGTQVI